MPLVDNPRSSHDTIYADPEVDLDQFTLQDLLRLRADIERRLPARSIKDVDLSKEIVLQFRATQELQNLVMQDKNVPANQRAQVANATAAILAQLTKLQTDLYTVERLKSIESKLVEAINELPKEVQTQFFEVYEVILGS